MNGVVNPMKGTSNIQRYNLSTGDVIAVGVSAASRVMLRGTEDTKVALDEGRIDTNYFTLLGGQTIILDPPNCIDGYFLWFELDSAASGVLEVWLQGGVS